LQRESPAAEKKEKRSHAQRNIPWDRFATGGRKSTASSVRKVADDAIPASSL
jgi:hypothetical protein